MSDFLDHIPRPLDPAGRARLARLEEVEARYAYALSLLQRWFAMPRGHQWPEEQATVRGTRSLLEEEGLR